NIHRIHEPYVFSTLNGYGHKSDQIFQIIEQLEFRGLAGGQGANIDSTGKNPQIDLALVQGGVNTITNTGPDRILNGDLIYWSVPPKDHPWERGRRGSERMVLHTLPYKPESDELSEDTLYKLLIKNNMSYLVNDKNMDARWPIMEGAKNLQQAIMQISLNALHTFLVSGIVTVAPNYTDVKVRAKNTNRYTSPQNLERRIDFLRLIGSSLGIKDLEKFKLKDDPKFTFRPNPPKSDTITTLSEFAMEVYFGKKNYALLAPLSEGTRTLPTGIKGALIKNQISANSDIFAAIGKTNDFTKRRIFAKANTPADPGKEMDIILGHYKF
ncbi:hypothetical protein LCGC14_2331000, partial [marine sediment metagenome]